MANGVAHNHDCPECRQDEPCTSPECRALPRRVYQTRFQMNPGCSSTARSAGPRTRPERRPIPGAPSPSYDADHGPPAGLRDAMLNATAAHKSPCSNVTAG
jgi:hypothetical protein